MRRGAVINRVAVVSDSVSCLPKELTEKYAIEIVPISLIINGSVYRDGVDITATKVYQLLETTKSVPTTSSPSPGDFVQIYRELSKSVDGVVCVTMGVQAGPGTLALAFYSEEDVDVG